MEREESFRDAAGNDWRCPPGYKHQRSVRDVALQLWGFKCSRDFDCCHRELVTQAVTLGLSCVPDVRTLRGWASGDDWSGQIARMMRSIAPDLVDGLVTDLLWGAIEGGAWLRGVMAGRVAADGKGVHVRARTILASLSMLGIPDLAHAKLREAVADKSQVPALPPGETVGAIPVSPDSSMPADMGLLKGRIATRLGLDVDQEDQGEDD